MEIKKNATMIILMIGAHTKNICNLKVDNVYASVANTVIRRETERERMFIIQSSGQVLIS